MRLGSLCSGAGGLDMAVEQVFGAMTAWHCEYNDGASKVLAYRYPGVPNHHDLIATDWTTVEPIDILCAGWPCQPFSPAGKKKGAADERAIWPHIADAVRVLRPRIICLENVSAVLGPEFGRVADSLAALGYDLRWTCLRAAAVGAPHRRERLFVVATVADAARERFGELDDGTGRDATRGCGQWVTIGSHRGGTARLAPDAASDGWHEGRPEPARLIRGSDAAVGDPADVALLPTPLARDGRQAAPGDYARHTPSLAAVDFYLPTPTASDGTGGGSHPDRRVGHTQQLIDEVLGSEQWGKYAAAIARWEAVTRPAPSPTEPNRNGNPRLNPAFSEWMMGWPAGWVTEVPGISRNDQLRIIGNGVVPQCAAAALTWLLNLEACGVVA